MHPPRTRRRALAHLILLAALAPGCDFGRREADARRAEVERANAAAEGSPPEAAPGGSSSASDVPAPRESSPPPASAPPSAAQSAWALAIARDIDAVGSRSRQLLSVDLMRRRRDPRQKSEDLVTHMEWCDEGSLKACLHAGHVLLFNECLFDRARVLYEKAASLAAALPGEALDQFAVDGQPQRYELQIGLRLSDPASGDDEQRRAIAAVCGAIAERDRPLWDDMFAQYDRGGRTAAATPSSIEERLALGAQRKEMLVEDGDRITALQRLHSGSARELRQKLAAAAGDLCAQGDLVSCGTAAYLQGSACNLDGMAAAYQTFVSGLEGLDAASRALAENLARDVIAPARAYSQGDPATREMLRRSMCRPHR